MVRRREEDAERKRGRGRNEGEMKSTQHSARRGWQCGGFRCRLDSGTVSGGEALDAVQQVRPGDSATTTRFLQVLKGVCATPSGH